MATIDVKDAAGATVAIEKPLTPGRAAATASRPVVLSNEDNATIGSITETAPASDTASSGLNGRLQRIAQRITSMIAVVGAKATAAAPTYIEGDASNPLSVNLKGGLRTIAIDPTTGADLDPTLAVSVVQKSAEYETVAASQTDQMMGPTGAAGDTIEGILVIPATTSPGAISIEDGATNTTVFTGGASSVLTLHPFWIPLNNIATASGGWEITTGANVSCIVFGNFT